MQVLWPHVKVCPLGVSEISSCQFLFWDPLHISITNGGRKLKFGTLVGIYAYYSSMYKNLSARGVWGNQELPLYFGTPLISLKLIELES